MPDIYAEVSNALNKAMERFSDQKIQKVLEEAGIFGESFAKARAAVDTGFMKENIGHDVRELTLNLYSNAEYSGYVDQGTIKMSAQPFMTPAGIATEDKIRQDIQRL